MHILEHCSLMPKNLPSCFGPVLSASLLHLSLYVFMLNRASESRTAGRSVPSELLHDETPPEVLPWQGGLDPGPTKIGSSYFFLSTLGRCLAFVPHFWQPGDMVTLKQSRESKERKKMEEVKHVIILVSNFKASQEI